MRLPQRHLWFALSRGWSIVSQTEQGNFSFSLIPSSPMHTYLLHSGLILFKRGVRKSITKQHQKSRISAFVCLDQCGVENRFEQLPFRQHLLLELLFLFWFNKTLVNTVLHRDTYLAAVCSVVWFDWCLGHLVKFLVVVFVRRLLSWVVTDWPKKWVQKNYCN